MFGKIYKLFVELNKSNTESYRSGHNGPDSKTFKCLRTEIAEKPLTLRFSGITSLLKRFEF